MEAHDSTTIPAVEVVAVTLNSDQGMLTLYQLMDFYEIKSSFISTHRDKLPGVYATLRNSLKDKAFCFLPKSKAFQDHFLAQYSITGEFVDDCPQGGCYLCLSSDSIQLDPSDYQPSEPSAEEVGVVEEDDECADFNPNYPYYPDTWITSDDFAQFGCVRFVTHDLGCIAPCPVGERRMVKQFTASAYDGDWELCLSHHREAKEEYCVPQSRSNCDLWPGATSSWHYEYGCKNPRRPVRWRE